MMRFGWLVCALVVLLCACGDDGPGSGTGNEGEPDAAFEARSCDEMTEALCQDACACRVDDDGRCAIATLVTGIPVTVFYDSAEDCVARHLNLRCDDIPDLEACDRALPEAACVPAIDDPEGSILLPEACVAQN